MPPSYDQSVSKGAAAPNAVLTKDQLGNRNYVLLIDKSGSMLTPDMNDESRYKTMQEATLSFCEVMDKLDPDGLDCCFFDNNMSWCFNTHKQAIERLFKTYKPSGGTLLAPPLKQALDTYFENREFPVTILVVTDGAPQDPDEVIRVIVDATKRMHSLGCKDEDIGIQLLQIGHDAQATKFLKMLDDNLVSNYGAMFDIVDTVSIDDVEERGGIKQVLLDAVND
jgi:hypothetical protein